MKDGASCSAGCGCGPQGGVSAQVPAGEPAAGAARFRSTFRVPGMDCPSEEVQIRAALGGLAQGLRFDLPGRTLVVDHAVPVGVVLGRLQKLGMGAELVESGPATAPMPAAPASDPADERRSLWWLLAINGVMFVVEVVAGWWADSSGLLADGLDMFADAAVYGTATDTPTAAVMNIMLVDKKLPADVVYDLLKNIYSPAGLETIQASHATAKANIKPETALRGITGTAVKLHDGAIRYYKETGQLK